MKKKKILIIQTAFIGDVILATSMIEYLQMNFPNAQLDFLLRKGNESIIQTNPHINKLYIWTKNINKYKSLFSLLKEIRTEKYDTVINIQRFFNSGFLTAFSGAKMKIGFHSNPLSFFFSDQIEHKIPHPSPIGENGFLHEVQRNAQLCAPIISNFQIPKADDLRLKLYFDENDERIIKELKTPEKYFVLAPSSVWYTKQWHADKWSELIEKLKDHGRIYLIGGPDDIDYIKSISEESIDIIHLEGKLSLRQSALLMKTAKRVFVNDSAPLHLASSVNAKVTAIFCSTVPDFGYGPLADDAVVMQANPRLKCMPCGLHGHKSCPIGTFECSSVVDVDDLLLLPENS